MPASGKGRFPHGVIMQKDENPKMKKPSQIQ
jgi:hypothetical protein